MIISIASGKGGTGKTTVATNIAVSVNGPVQLLDCDVEEPNAHLFLRPTIEETRTITTPVPTLTWKNALSAKNVLKYAGSGPLPFSVIRCSPFPNCAIAAADAWRYARRGRSPKREGNWVSWKLAP
jgi:cellulose biosynthesis protein BcsQ